MNSAWLRPEPDLAVWVRRGARCSPERGATNSMPKEHPALLRTTPSTCVWPGVWNSTLTESPARICTPAYNAMPPSLISLTRPETRIAFGPFINVTETGRSTGCRGQRRRIGKGDIAPHLRNPNHLNARELAQQRY